MKTLARNRKPFTYCLYSGTTTPVYDEYGNDTGELTVEYGEPQVAWGNISPATGASAVEMFGGVDNYDKIIVTDDVDIPIDTDAVLFVGKTAAMMHIIRNFTKKFILKTESVHILFSEWKIGTLITSKACSCVFCELLIMSNLCLNGMGKPSSSAVEARAESKFLLHVRSTMI